MARAHKYMATATPTIVTDAARWPSPPLAAGRGVRRRGEQPARDRADENGEEGACVHQRVAAHQLALAQVLRHERILERAENGGQHA
jgi:hypothetical protein